MLGKKVEDMKMKSAFDKLGALDSRMSEIQGPAQTFSPKAEELLMDKVSLLNKKLTQPIEGTPAEVIKVLSAMMQAAVNKEVIPSNLVSPSVESEDELMFFIAKLSAMIKDRETLRDFVEFAARPLESNTETDDMSEPEVPSRRDMLMQKLNSLS